MTLRRVEARRTCIARGRARELRELGPTRYEGDSERCSRLLREEPLRRLTCGLPELDQRRSVEAREADFMGEAKNAFTRRYRY